MIFASSPTAMGQRINGDSDGTLAGPAQDSFGGRFGISISYAGDVNQDGFDDLLIGDTDFREGSGGAHLVMGSTSGLSGEPSDSAQEAIFTLSEDASGGGAANVSGVGATITGVGDINNDQIDDFFVGSPWRRVDIDTSGGLNNEGEDFPIGGGHIVYGRPGGFSGTLDLRDLANGTGGFEILGRDLFGRLGRSATAAGDFNGDGIDDFAVSAPRAGQQSKRDSGEVYVIFGRNGGYTDSFSLGTISGTGIDVDKLDGHNGFVIAGHESDQYLGASISGIGDFNRDGFDDLAITSPSSSRFVVAGMTPRVGAVYVVFGSGNGYAGELDLTSLDGTNGFAVFDHFSEDNDGQIAGIGDFNDDGFDDFAVAAKGIIVSAKIVLGSDNPFPAMLASNELGERAKPVPGNPTRLAWAGDVNGDDYDDFLTGSISITSRSFGIVYGTRAPVPTRQTFRPEDSSARSGYSLAGGGDFNGDGIPDVFSGGPMTERGSSGAVTSVQGTDSITPAYREWISKFYPGVTDRSIIAPARDANGDGLSNGFTYLVDGDPSQFTPGSVLEFRESNGSLVTSYRRSDRAAEIISSWVETSNDLNFWIPTSDQFFGITVQEEDDFYGPGIDRVSVTIPPTFFAEVFATEPGSQIYSRLQVAVP